MTQLSVEGKRLPSPAPTAKKGKPVSLHGRPELRFQWDVIAAWLQQSKPRSVVLAPAAATQV